MTNKSSLVVSNQSDTHEDLEQVVNKHLNSAYKKPYRDFSNTIFEQLDQLQSKINYPIILDSGCGTGESSVNLAKQFQDKCIIGIDQSAKRLERFIHDNNIYHQDNLLLARADVVDIWRLAKQANWSIEKHFLLYPNPWPKKDQLKRRWHGHPVFPEMMTLCENIELRTNWKIYAEEFKKSLALIINKNISIQNIEVDYFISPFEKKYYESGHSLFCVMT